jgi:hypothetical protein
MNKKSQKAQLDAALVTALVEESHKSYLQLAREFGTSINYITGVAQKNNLTRKRGRGSPAWHRKEQAQKQGA